MADFDSKYTGEQVEEFLDQIANGDVGGGIETETDPIFSASPAATITNEDKAAWDGKQDEITDLDTIRSGAEKGATALQSYTEQYKGTVTGVTFYGKDYTPDSYGKVYMGYPDVGAVREITVNGSTKTPTDGAVDLGTFLTQHQDISQKADLSNGKILASQLPDYILGQVMYGGVIQSGDANSIVVQPSANYKAKYSLEGNTVTVVKYQFWSQQGVYFISGKNGTFLDLEVKVGDWLISTGSSVAKVDNTDAVSSVAGLTGVIDASALGKELSYNDLKDKPTIPTAVTESTVSGWGFTKNTGTYSKPSSGIPKSDLASAVQTSLGKADTALQTEQYRGTVTAVKINGSTKTPDSSGIVDLGTIEGGSTGGSSSGSSDINWVLLNSSVSNHTLSPNTQSVLITKDDTAYNFTFNTASASELRQGKVQEFGLRLQLGNSDISYSQPIGFPDNIKWANGVEPTFIILGVMEFSFVPAASHYNEIYLLGTWGAYEVGRMGEESAGPL